MTDADDRRNDLASGLLDGTLPDEAAAAARRDPTVVARVAELAAARDRLRHVPPPDPVARDRAVAAALAAFDPAAGRDGAADLAAARRRRAAGVPRWLGAAAAAVAVVAAVAGLALMSGDSQDEDQATSSVSDEAGSQESSSEAGDDSAADAGGEDGGAAAGAPEATLAAGGYLGAFTDAGALVDSVATGLRSGDFSADRDAPRAEESVGASPGAGCPAASLPPAAQRDGARLVGTADVTGVAVQVWLVPDPGAAGEHRIVAVSAACEAVVDQPLG